MPSGSATSGTGMCTPGSRSSDRAANAAYLNQPRNARFPATAAATAPRRKRSPRPSRGAASFAQNALNSTLATSHSTPHPSPQK